MNASIFTSSTHSTLAAFTLHPSNPLRTHLHLSTNHRTPSTPIPAPSTSRLPSPIHLSRPPAPPPILFPPLFHPIPNCIRALPSLTSSLNPTPTPPYPYSLLHSYPFPSPFLSLYTLSLPHLLLIHFPHTPLSHSPLFTATPPSPPLPPAAVASAKRARERTARRCPRLIGRS